MSVLDEDMYAWQEASRRPLRLYLASRFSRAEEMNTWAMHLRGFVYEVTSRWHSDPSHRIGGTAENTGPPVQEFNARLADEDRIDLMAADVVVSFTGGGGRGGRHVEFGLGLALGKRMVLIGNRENVFHWLPEVEVWPTFPPFVERLNDERRSRKWESPS